MARLHLTVVTRPCRWQDGRGKIIELGIIASLWDRFTCSRYKTARKNLRTVTGKWKVSKKSAFCITLNSRSLCHSPAQTNGAVINTLAIAHTCPASASALLLSERSSGKQLELIMNNSQLQHSQTYHHSSTLSKAFWKPLSNLEDLSYKFTSVFFSSSARAAQNI